MKTISLIITLAFFAIAMAQSNTEDEGVIINGVKWATRNVDTPNTFVDNTKDYGCLYTWDEAQSVCPEGWRIPNKDELNSLANAKKERTESGYKFGTEDAMIFLPASGFRNNYNNEIYGIGVYGYYWSSSLGDIEAYELGFDEKYLLPGNYQSRTNALSVRCVSK